MSIHCRRRHPVKRWWRHRRAPLPPGHRRKLYKPRRPKYPDVEFTHALEEYPRPDEFQKRFRLPPAQVKAYYKLQFYSARKIQKSMVPFFPYNTCRNKRLKSTIRLKKIYQQSFLWLVFQARPRPYAPSAGKLNLKRIFQSYS